VKRQVEQVGDAPRVPGVARAAAALLAVGPAIVAVVRPGAHEQADDVVALLPQQVRRHRAVHPAAHRADHARRHDALHGWYAAGGSAGPRMVCRLRLSGLQRKRPSTLAIVARASPLHMPTHHRSTGFPANTKTRQGLEGPAGFALASSSPLLFLV